MLIKATRTCTHAWLSLMGRGGGGGDTFYDHSAILKCFKHCIKCYTRINHLLTRIICTSMLLTATLQILSVRYNLCNNIFFMDLNIEKLAESSINCYNSNCLCFVLYILCFKRYFSWYWDNLILIRCPHGSLRNVLMFFYQPLARLLTHPSVLVYFQISWRRQSSSLRWKNKHWTMKSWRTTDRYHILLSCPKWLNLLFLPDYHLIYETLIFKRTSSQPTINSTARKQHCIV